MCLYIGLGLFWLFAAFNDEHRNTAVLTTGFFAAGLVTGRIISFFADGQPSPLLVFYIFIEFALLSYCLLGLQTSRIIPTYLSTTVIQVNSQIKILFPHNFLKDFL